MSPQSPEPLAQLYTRVVSTELRQDNLEKEVDEKYKDLIDKSKQYITRRETQYYFKETRTEVKEIRSELGRTNKLIEDYIKEQKERAEKMRAMWAKIFIGVATSVVAAGILGGFTWMLSILR